MRIGKDKQELGSTLVSAAFFGLEAHVILSNAVRWRMFQIEREGGMSRPQSGQSDIVSLPLHIPQSDPAVMHSASAMRRSCGLAMRAAIASDRIHGRITLPQVRMR